MTLSDSLVIDKYMHAQTNHAQRTISENVEEGPTLKRVRSTENPEFEIEGVTDIAKSLADDSIQPDLKSYPKRKFGTKFRSFKEWFHTRTWLEYSQTSDAAFYYCCRAFCHAVSGSDKWKNAMEEKKGLKAHETSSSHLENALKWSSYKTVKPVPLRPEYCPSLGKKS